MHDTKERARNAPGMTLQDGREMVDMAAMRAYRLARVQSELEANECAAAVLMGPINIRYATGTGRGGLFGMHCPWRTAVVPRDSQVTLFEGSRAGTPQGWMPETVAERRFGLRFAYFPAGERNRSLVESWARQIADIVREVGSGQRIAVDVCDPLSIHALEAQELEVIPGEPMMEHATLIKCDEEIACMIHAVTVADTAMARMRAALTPGMTESDLLAILHHTNIEMGGEWIEYRLIASGGHTNPWSIEAGDKIIRAGELVAFDCGLIGPFGYSADVSRTFLCKPGRPTSDQMRLYGLAYENIQRNLDLVKAGTSFRELSERSWMPPQEFHAHRYPMSMHGIGMGDEWPSIPWPIDWDNDGYDGVLEENMAICVESFIGSEHGGEGVKLEEQLVVTRDGYQLMSTFPFEDELLG